jgi:hypothetical protein
LRAFIARIEGYLEFFFGEIKGIAMAPTDIRKLALKQPAKRKN